jgi:hypothetical protein
MPRQVGETAIEFLTRCKFGPNAVQRSEKQEKLRQFKPSVSLPGAVDRSIIFKFQAGLRALSESELAQLEWQEIQKEEQHLFGETADFDHWGKMADWTLDQAIALSFGREPEKVNWITVTPHLSWSAFAKNYVKLRERALSFQRQNLLFDPTHPTLYLAWAQRGGVEVPAELVRCVEAQGNPIADWRSLFERAIAQRDEAVARAADLERQVSRSADSPKPLATREKETLLKMIIAMAIDGYGYGPNSSKSPTPKELADAVHGQGLDLDVDTIRAKLKEAAALLPSNWQKK